MSIGLLKTSRVRRGVQVLALIGLLALLVPLLSPPLPAKAQLSFVGRLYLISKATNGTIGNNQSYQPDISSDGRYVTFVSDATNLVSNDNNGRADIFVYDRQSNTFEIVSLQSDGDQADDSSFEPAISGDGRWVVFCSYARNLVGGDDNNRPDIFLYDREDNDVRRLSDASNGDDGNGDSCGQATISNNGQYVAFQSDASNLVNGDTNSVRDVFLYNRGDDTLRRITAQNGTQTNGTSSTPSISGDGRYLAFQSDATNLISGDDNGRSDIFVYDRDENDIERASERQDGTDNTAGSFFPVISGDGRFVVFEAGDGNLVGGDDNGRSDIFLHVREGNAIERISLETGGGQANDNSTQASISDDGRYVSFTSAATDLDDFMGNTTNIFVRDRQTNTTISVSYTEDDDPGNQNSDAPQISGNGRYIVFASAATNLLPEDTNTRADVYLWDKDAAPPAEVNFTITPSVGRAGTVFTGQITAFTPNVSVSITVNGQGVGSLLTDTNGNASFGLNSSNASDGRYYVRVFDGTNERLAVFVVAANAPLVSGNPPVIFSIPNGVAYRALYLPYVVVNE
jgi:Tol biopolymer transport system component